MHRKNLVYYISLIFIVLTICTSCKVTQPYQALELPGTKLYRDRGSSDTTTIATIHWSEFFKDNDLKEIIAEGIAQNLDIKIAYTRIDQAEAYYKRSQAAFMPTIDSYADVNASKFSQGREVVRVRDRITQYQLGLSSVWEIDIWGKLKSTKKANLASVLQADAAARAVRTRLIADIATHYYTLLALDKQLGIIYQTVENWDATVQTMRELKAAAMVTEAAVVQSEAQRYAAEVTIPNIKQRIRETENALSILLGVVPGSIARSSLEQQKEGEMLKVGVPAQLLANRPDVLAAELNFRYYFELTNVARTYFYPSLSITGSTGLSALSVSNLFDPTSIMANIGAGLTQPVFNQRLNQTRLQIAKAEQQEALYSFQYTLLSAGREVSDALSLYEAAEKRIGIRSTQLTALNKSVLYSSELLQNGFAIYPEVITAKQSLLQAELASVDDHLQKLLAIVNLYRSLGGGAF